MSYTNWLQKQVDRLADEIRQHTVFDSTTPATPQQLEELRSKVVIHKYLQQQLRGRVTMARPIEKKYDTQEILLAHVR